MLGKLLQQLVVQQLFSGECALLRRERFVFERLEFRCDVALGVFQGLAPPIVIGNFVDVRVCDLDVKAMHPVVLDFEIGDARACTFARLQIEQKGAAVVLDCAQLVQLGVVAIGDHAAFSNHCTGLLLNRTAEQRQQRLTRPEHGSELGDTRTGLAGQQRIEFGK